MAKIKDSRVPSVGEDKEIPNTHDSVDRGMKWHNHFRKLFGSF